MRRPLLLVTGLGFLTAGLASAPFAGAAPTPKHTVNDHFATFTPATVVDPILFGGEPGLTMDPTTKSGRREFVDWPVSSRTNIGVFFRSTDGGLSFQKRYADVNDPDSGGPACSGRQVPYCPSGGGGDTDTQVDPGTGNIYLSSQESLANEAVGTSFDHGNTFPADHVDPLTHKAGGDVDRQWLGYWKGTKTVFLAYHSPIVGEYIMRSDNAGATGSWYLPGSAVPVDNPASTPQVPFVAQSGSMAIDNTGGPHNHTIYIGYLSAIPDANNFLTETFHIAVSTDGAKTFKSYEVAKGLPYNFTKIWLDTKGNIYAVWTDQDTNKTFLATSKSNVGKNRKNPGSVWRGPYLINVPPARMTIFPDVRAGSPGRMAAIYYGTNVKAPDPDSVKPGQGGWYPYVAMSTNALCGWKANPCTSPSFHQMRVAHKINHDDNICTAGTACAATGGNRNMADYWDIDVDRQGHLGFVWDDTVNGIVGPVVKVARQASGPSLYAGKPRAHRSMRHNGMSDVRGDARFPISGNNIKTAKNHPTLDLRGTGVFVKGSKLEFRIVLKKGSGLAAGVPTGNDGTTPLQQAKYVVRWDFGKQVYYAGANVPTDGAPTYFSGKISDAEGITSPTNPDNANGFGNSYSALGPATGRVRQNTMIIDVPLSSVGKPGIGSRLKTVGTYTMVGAPDSAVTLETLPITVDGSPTFDTKLRAKTIQPRATLTKRPATTSSGSVSSGSVLPNTGEAALLSLFGALLIGAALIGRRVTH